jgi:hypothetical protein
MSGSKTMNKHVAGILLIFLFGSSAQAALISRAGGQAYYDDVLDITWLADANLADTETFGVTGINADGSMVSTTKANEWIAAMNTANYLGRSDWRLPNIVDTGTPGCNGSYGGTDCGYNVQTKSAPVDSYQAGQTVYSEMAHLYSITLGNMPSYDTSGNSNDCSGFPPYCLTSTGPFSNLQADGYWSGTPYAPDPNNDAWVFYFYSGGQGVNFQSAVFHAWAVSPGDIAAIPVPGAVWLLGSALGLLGVVRRRSAT